MTKPKHRSRKKKYIVIGAGSAISVILVLSLVFFLPGAAGPDPEGWDDIPQGNASFYLYVQDSAGTGLKGADVYVSGGVFGEGRALGRTGVEGYFNAINFPDGTYTFWAVYNPNFITNLQSSNQTVTLFAFSDNFVGVLATP